MAHLSKIFKQQPVDIPNRSGMDLSFENILSMTTGTLIPVFVEEVLPNETYSLGYMCEAQLPPMATEFYGRIDMRLEAFFVPNRILWAGWQDFMTMPVYNPFSPQVYRPAVLPSIHRTFKYDNYTELKTTYGFDTDYVAESELPFFGPGSLSDYLGIKVQGGTEPASVNEFITFPNMLSFLAYHKIYDDWYRNPNIVTPLFIRSNGAANDNISYLPYNNIIDTEVNEYAASLLGVTGGQTYKAKPEIGHLSYSMPITSSLAFYGNASSSAINAQKTPNLFSLHQRCWEKDYYTTCTFYPQAAMSPASISIPDGQSNLTIPQIRSANVLQRWLERNNIAGMRYSDQIKATWGILPSDALLDRPLFLGSSKFGLYTKGVASSTYSAESETYNRNPFNGAVGARAGSTHGYGKDSLFDTFTSTEHGFLMVIASVVPHAYYGSGTRRYLSRSKIGDFANPLLQGLGEQAVTVTELMMNPYLAITGSTVEAPKSIFSTDYFGYQQQYSEYKYHDDEVHGLLQPTGSLSAFTLQRYFDNFQLNKDFVEIAIDELDSVLAADYSLGAVTWADFFFSFKKVTPLAEYVIPTLGDLKNTHKENVPYRGRQL
nr:MAG TPA: Major capsid protein [Microviridae sp.]